MVDRPDLRREESSDSVFGKCRLQMGVVGDDAMQEAKSDMFGTNQNEERAIKWIRSLTIILLVSTTIALSLTIYFEMSRGEKATFEKAFDNKAQKVISAFAEKAVNRVEALAGFAETMVSFAKASNMTWPMVTIPDFEIRGRRAMKLASLISILFCPLVHESEREDWERYSSKNQWWFAESLAVQKARNPEVSADETELVGKLPTSIVDLKGDYFRGDGPFTPTWYDTVLEARTWHSQSMFRQAAPAIPLEPIQPTANYNLISHSEYTDVLNATLLSGDIAISRTYVPFNTSDIDTFIAYNISNIEAHTKTNKLALYLKHWKAYGRKYMFDPVSDFVFPIYAEKEGSSQIVGLLKCFVYWRTYFLDILPSNEGPLRIILHNSCGEAYTYELMGGNVEYIADRDEHDSEFDSMVVEADVQTITSTGEVSFASDDQSQLGTCAYGLRIYPTKMVKLKHITNTPLLYSVGVCFIFVFTAAVFVVYDFLVRRRQEKVVDTAAQHGAIVSSLFPKAIRDQMLHRPDKVVKTPSTSSRLGLRNFKSLKEYVEEESSMLSEEAAPPIAENFDRCTVLFCDIAGFTAWSDRRAPRDVFGLLQTIYHAFDNLARKTCVFKETIGATGLPEYQENHAALMAEFAIGCMKRMDRIAAKLAPKYGADTAALGCRTGIHSGRLTAGVLRGLKSRFQLFGDTVNTASRMESTSEKGRIQISSTTYKELVKSAFKDDIVPRESLVEIKGKGPMQTYWLNFPAPDLGRKGSFSASSSFGELIRVAEEKSSNDDE